MARQVSSVLYLRFVRVNCHFLYNFVCECRLVFVYNGDGALLLILFVVFCAFL